FGLRFFILTGLRRVAGQTTHGTARALLQFANALKLFGRSFGLIALFAQIARDRTVGPHGREMDHRRSFMAFVAEHRVQWWSGCGPLETRWSLFIAWAGSQPYRIPARMPMKKTSILAQERRK